MGGGHAHIVAGHAIRWSQQGRRRRCPPRCSNGPNARPRWPPAPAGIRYTRYSSPVPIGEWIVSFAFDLASQWAGEEAVFTKAAFWLIGAGILGAVIAAVFGLMDFIAIPRGTRAFTIGLTHLVLNLTVVAVFAVNFAIRRGELDDAVEPLPIALSALSLAVLAISGWLGGTLIYRYGVRVVNEEAQAEGYR